MVFFGDALDSKTLRERLISHRERHVQRLARYEEPLPQIREEAAYPALALLFGVDYERMVNNWIDKLLTAEGAPPDNGKKAQNALEARVSIGG